MPRTTRNFCSIWPTVKLPLPGLERFAVKDDGDEAFEQGIDGVVNGLLKAFDEHITMPLLASQSADGSFSKSRPPA